MELVDAIVPQLLRAGGTLLHQSFFEQGHRLLHLASRQMVTDQTVESFMQPRANLMGWTAMDNKEALGWIWLRNIDWIARTAELLILLSSRGRGRRRSREMLEAVQAEASKLGIEQVWFQVPATGSDETKRLQRLVETWPNAERIGRMARMRCVAGEIVDIELYRVKIGGKDAI